MAHRVILADDSVAIHRVVNLTFTGEDVEIVSVHNGTDAIRKANEQQPDLVIADIFMPGLNGYDVCARLRQHAATRDVPVILLVGAFESFDQAKANEVGATAHIMKPIEPQTLLKLVGNLLKETRSENGSVAAAVETNGKDANTAEPSVSDRPPISLVEDRGSESEMESFINSLQSPSSKPQDVKDFFVERKEPARVFNLAESSNVAEHAAEPKKFKTGEDLVAHLSGNISTDEQADFPPKPKEERVGIRTDELESLIEGLGGIVDPQPSSKEEQTATSVDDKPSATGMLVSPELVNEISERVVMRLRETLREEVKAAIEDALNQYLKDLES